MTDVSRRAEAHGSSFAKVGLVFPGLAVLAGLDAFHDVSIGMSPPLAAAELLGMIGLIAGAFFYWVQSRRARRDASSLLNRLDLAKTEAERWRREAANVLPALGAAVQRQLERWGLSDDERRTALLLLSGLPLGHIASRIGTTTRSAREMVLSVYTKAGVGGRAELSAFFLQDLLYLAGLPKEVDDEQFAAEL